MKRAASSALADVATAAAQTPSLTPGVLGVILILGCSYTFNGMDRSVFPALLSPINKEFGLTVAQGGFLSNTFTLNIALFGALAGWFMGRFGRKWTLVGGWIAYSIFTFLIPLAHSYPSLAFFRAMTGAGEALQIAASYSMLGAYFGRRRGAFLGIHNAFFAIGTFLGPFIGTHLFAALGTWRPPFYLYGTAGIVAALGVVVLVPASFSEKIDAEEPADSGAEGCADGLLNLNSTLCVIAFFLTGFSFLAYTALYTLFLRDALGYSVVAAGTAFSMYGIGGLTGVFGGWVSDRLRRFGLGVSLAIMAGSGYLMFNGVSSLAGQMLLSFVFGAMLSGFLYPRFVAVAQRCVQPRHIGGAMSLMLPAFYLAGFISAPVFGNLAPVIGWARAGTVSITATAAIAGVITLFINPSRMRGT